MSLLDNDIQLPDFEKMTSNCATTERVYNFIRAFIETQQYPPTVRDICAACNLKSTSVASYHLEKLEQQGRISRPVKGGARAIRITG